MEKDQPEDWSFSSLPLQTRLLDYGQPIPQQELESTDQERQTAHRSVSERGAKGDHHGPPTDGGQPRDGFPLLVDKEEVPDGADNAEGEQHIAHGVHGEEGGLDLIKELRLHSALYAESRADPRE